MTKYIHYFKTEGEYNDERLNNYIEHWGSLTETENGRRIDYDKTDEQKRIDSLLITPLTFEITGDGVIKWSAVSTIRTIQYNKNETGWIDITSAEGDSAPTISVVAGDIIQFKGNNIQYGVGNGSFSTFNGTTCQFKVYGNIMSLINSSDFSTLKTFSTGHNFDCFFSGLYGFDRCR